MTRQIQVGDLVMVVRSGHSCAEKLLGRIAIVEELISTTGRCKHCGVHVLEGTVHAAKLGDDYSVPVAWLKRIDPPAIPETVETDERITA